MRKIMLLAAYDKLHLPRLSLCALAVAVYTALRNYAIIIAPSSFLIMLLYTNDRVEHTISRDKYKLHSVGEPHWGWQSANCMSFKVASCHALMRTSQDDGLMAHQDPLSDWM